MPIYAYRCTACGHVKDVLQKVSDPPLAVCPACGASTFAKQVTAAGFQLKGSGWYVTDFRDGGKKPAAKPDAGGDAAPAADAVAGDAKPGADTPKTAPADAAAGGAAQPAADAVASKPAAAAGTASVSKSTPSPAPAASPPPAAGR